MAIPLIKAESLTKNFGKNGQYHVIKNVNLTINKGDFVVITGKSGSGKSSLLHLLSGLETPSSGSIYYLEKDISKLSDNERSSFRNKTIGFIFQSYNLQPFLTVHDNISVPAIFQGKKTNEINKDISKLLHALDLSGKESFYPSELSGGQCQRVAIARALVNNPSVIFADEPTGNLDTANTKQIIDLLKQINKDLGVTIILVTHEEGIAKLATKHLIVHDGEITQ